MMRRGFLGKQLANFLLIFLVITPGMIAYWRGLWLLMDLYFYPNDQNLSAWFSTGLGLSFSFFFVLLQNFWRKLLVRCSSPFRGLIWRVLAYLIGFCSVSAWRGVWMLLGSDHITKSPTLAAGLTHLVGFVVLLLTRSTSTVVFSPGFTLSDFYFVPEELNFLSYHWPALEKRKFGPLLLHVGNCFFTVVVIGVAGVACWRGVWTLLDIWTAGNGRLPSILLSLCLGYSILAGSFCVCGCIHDKIDLPMSRLSQAMEQAFTYILIIGDINLWRAMFYIQDDYIFPENVTGSAWLSHSIGFATLLFGQGMVNLIGSPVCCIICKPGARENFYMGEFLDMASVEDSQMNIGKEGNGGSSNEQSPQVKLEGMEKL